ncbi:MAG: STAS domain-containing protein [Fibrobacterota bacterium]
MEIYSDNIGKFILMGVKGSTVCLNDYEMFGSYLSSLVEEGREDIVIDLSSSEFIGTGIINSIISARNKLRKKGGSIFIVSSNKNILDIFEILQMNALVPIYKSIDEFKKTHLD